MSIALLSILLFLCAVAAGVLGSLVGIGGGIVIVPLLTLVFGFNIHTAIGASIVSVIATSSGGAAAFVRDHLANVRLAMVLQVATTTGAASGAFVAGALEGRLLFLLFGLVLLASILPMAFRLRRPDARVSDDWLARSLGLSGTYREANGATVAYGVRRVPGGFVLMYLAGLVSGLLGIGSGVLKVLAMDTMMGLPIKVSSATSNFMIGVTAAASAGIYYWRGDVNPIVAGPIALGVLLGATFGARSLVSLPAETIRLLFLIVLGVVSIEMLLRGAGVA